MSFNRYGDRGRIDLLAYHPRGRAVVVVEVKTVIADVQDLLGGLDVKARMAARLAREFGWPRCEIVPMILLAEASTGRRRIAAHAALFGRFALRGPSALAWLRRPHGAAPDGILVFSSPSNANGASVRRPSRHRVRCSRRRASVATGRPRVSVPAEAV